MVTSIACGNGIILDMAEGGMSATLVLRREEIEKGITEKDILEALKSSKIEINENVEKRVAEFVQLCAKQQDQAEPFVVAEGTPPFEGTDETFLWDPVLEEKKKAWEEDSQVSYYNMNNIITVDQDTVIGTLEPMMPQSKGIDIHGKILKPRSKSPISLKIDHTIRKDGTDPIKLISNTPGRVVVAQSSLSIDEVLAIKGDVGFATGNIKSDVPVHVTGSVPDRFEVHSKKSVTVELAIESALVEAGEDINVRRGIVGRHAGKVCAKKNIIAKYCSEANIVAGGDLMITSQLLNCRSQTSGKFVGTHASIIGGHLYTKLGGEATDIGSEGGAQTRIFIGPTPDVIGEQATREENILAKRNAIQQIRETVQPLLKKAKNLTAQQIEQATALLNKAQKAEDQLDEEEGHKKEVVLPDDSHTDAKFTVNGTIYGHVTISFGKRAVSFKNDFKGPVTLEVRKVKNVTEVVAVNTLTGSVTILKSRKITDDDLHKDFKPIAEMLKIKMSAPAEPVAAHHTSK